MRCHKYIDVFVILEIFIQNIQNSVKIVYLIYLICLKFDKKKSLISCQLSVNSQGTA